MNPSQAFTKNFLKLYSESNIKNATALMELINQRSGEKVIDNSYISKMLKAAKNGETLNPSIDKVAAIAVGFNVTLTSMITEDVNSGYAELDVKKLEAAYRHTDSFCESANTDSSEFKARAFKLQYEALLFGNNNLAFKMHQLAKEFGI